MPSLALMVVVLDGRRKGGMAVTRDRKAIKTAVMG